MKRQCSSRSLVRPGTAKSYMLKNKRVLWGHHQHHHVPPLFQQGQLSGSGGGGPWTNVMAMSEHLDLDPDGLLRSGLAESAVNILPKCVTEQINQVHSVPVKMNASLM